MDLNYLFARRPSAFTSVLKRWEKLKFEIIAAKANGPYGAYDSPTDTVPYADDFFTSASWSLTDFISYLDHYPG